MATRDLLKSLAENTVSAGIPAVVPIPMVVSTTMRQQRRQRQRRQQRPVQKPAVQEADTATPTEAAIPPNAKKDPVYSDQPAGQAQVKPGSTMEPLIPTAVALVAPDTTPEADAPLSPEQVPTVQASSPISLPTIKLSGDPLRDLFINHATSFKPEHLEIPPAIDPCAPARPKDNPIMEASAVAKRASEASRKAKAPPARPLYRHEPAQTATPLPHALMTPQPVAPAPVAESKDDAADMATRMGFKPGNAKVFESAKKITHAAHDFLRPR